MVDWFLALGLEDMLGVAALGLAAYAAIVATVAAGAAISANRRERNRDKRKPPIFEVGSYPSPDFPGWMSLQIIVRNVENVSVRVRSITAPKGVLIVEAASLSTGSPSDPNPSPVLKDPKSEARRSIPHYCTAAPVGNPTRRGRLHGDMGAIQLLAHGWKQGHKLKFEHEWLDGNPD